MRRIGKQRQFRHSPGERHARDFELRRGYEPLGDRPQIEFVLLLFSKAPIRVLATTNRTLAAFVGGCFHMRTVLPQPLRLFGEFPAPQRLENQLNNSAVRGRPSQRQNAERTGEFGLRGRPIRRIGVEGGGVDFQDLEV